jgi:hypothetical protein
MSDYTVDLGLLEAYLDATVGPTDPPHADDVPPRADA